MTIIDRIIAEYSEWPRIVAVLRQKRWLLLSEPEDVRQCVELAKLMHPLSELRQARELTYQLAELAAQPHAGQSLRKRPRRPASLVPSKEPTGGSGRPRKHGGNIWTPEEARAQAKKGGRARMLMTTLEEKRDIASRGLVHSSRTSHLSPERRKEIARNAVNARWKNVQAKRRA
jgi:hypothetical protein